MMEKRRTSLVVALCLLVLFSIPSAQARQEVYVTIKGEAVTQKPGQLYTNTPYTLIVRVLDKDDRPKINTAIRLSLVGPGSIVGEFTGTTDPSGVARLSVSFDDVGTLEIFVEGRRVARILVLYERAPLHVIAFPVALVALLVAGVLWTAYRGPLSLIIKKGKA